ncbi:MAG: hypothetical protein ACREAC_00995, partial [Blastocatellia bacterium]
MKLKSLVFLAAVVLASLSLLAFRQRRFEPDIKAHPQFDIKSLKAAQTIAVGEEASKIADIARSRSYQLPSTVEGMLGGFQFDKSGRIWFRVRNGSTENVFRLDPLTGDCHQVNSSNLGAGGEVEGFALTDGGAYVIVAHPPRRGSIVFMTEDGAVDRKIETGSFLPTQVSIDVNGQIWALGQLYSST